MQVQPGDFIKINGKDNDVFIVTGVYSNGLSFAPTTGGNEDGCSKEDAQVVEYAGKVTILEAEKGNAGKNVKEALGARRARNAEGHPGDGSRWEEI